MIQWLSQSQVHVVWNGKLNEGNEIGAVFLGMGGARNGVIVSSN